MTSDERGNPDTEIDRRHVGGVGWTVGNEVTPLIHGDAYFAELLVEIAALTAGDLLLFTDWRGDPDERLSGPGTEIAQLLCEAAERGVTVRGLMWRSHMETLRFNAAENRHLGQDVEAAGGVCLLDMRVRTGGCHHQKLVVLRHHGAPHRDVAYVGGIDLCYGRRDDRHHRGDSQARRISRRYGPRPPWHDLQLSIRGPAVGDVEAGFRERWCDPARLSRNPLHRLRDLVSDTDTTAKSLPAQMLDPPRQGSHAVQVLRTYPYRHDGYPFARRGERSVARAYFKVLRNAQHLIYVEDQYLWSRQVAAPFAEAMLRQPGLRMIAVLPGYPDQDGLTGNAQLYGREQALTLLREAGGERFAVYSVENGQGTPVYVHAKTCIVDDVWACVGSDNLNLRSWTYDSELSCAVLDQDASSHVARQLRLALSREHLDRGPGEDVDLRTPADVFAAFARSAATLDQWHSSGGQGVRPAGRLRCYQHAPMGRWTRMLAAGVYRTLCDPDGRPARLRRHDQF